MKEDALSIIYKHDCFPVRVYGVVWKSFRKTGKLKYLDNNGKEIR